MPGDLKNIIIVGSGHAGVELASALRHRGFDGSITIVGDEPDLPYQRPPLSKEFLKGPDDAGLPLKGEAFFPANSITLRLGERAKHIDRDNREIVLDDDNRLAYDHLILATGARNRIPPIPGLDHPSILELRTLENARLLNERLASLTHVTVVGGGFIGLEVAGLLRARDIAVDLVESTSVLMGRVLSSPMSAWFRSFHEQLGTKLHFETLVQGVHRDGAHTEVRLSNGRHFQTDSILIAAGIMPNAELAAEAGLSVDNGIVVDELLVTGDAAISAMGDCAAYPNVFTGGMARLESVQNAVDQARCIAARLTGEAKPYDGFPWFWSNQGSARLQIAGLSNGHDGTVLRGDPESGKFSIFLYRGDRLIAVESVNAAADHMMARRLLAAHRSVPKAVAADPAANLKELI
ncbi:3-phenylpropionate/trans-cinnamate dioxygenase ferredoxin reductase subunit [Mesorhizobium albiziae]|uniref:3-phenylpropionate/trans-cinnamate dioxygenase ferredoxin reductase subunit n=1 Tax=Neomesorhizobium albiziae TaxID=335020 RepID=A0A1I3YA42_9HYPH|nr:FAD-dependent oxidoreductase [Mesorhizobium albiziae]GLS30009.1 oxidoreductase [Mesorhizobium albiziae]SFK28239.1 3-phenylpropionate/trans-cinnamate dioxygenase ferredoxin reductase subunit [Mesorhizobium albiziae]